MSRPGRPSKGDLLQREQRKAAAARHDRERAEIEATIAREGLRLPADWPSPFSPAVQFVLGKLKGVPIERFDAAMRQSLIDLLKSDVPLDENIRATIAAELHKLTYPQSAERIALRAKVQVLGWAMAAGERRGEKPMDTYDQLAPQYGHASGEALRKWVENHEHLLLED